MPHRKPHAALATVTAALALAVPAASASASAAPSAPAVRTAAIGITARLQPGSLPCLFLIQQVRFALLTHNTLWADVASNAFVYSGCGGAAI